MTAHPPGPWDYGWSEMGGYDCMSDAFYVRDANHNVVATLDTKTLGTRADAPHLEAAARLIAAAPELEYASCAMLEWLVDDRWIIEAFGRGDISNGSAALQTVRRLRAAVAKATGTS